MGGAGPGRTRAVVSNELVVGEGVSQRWVWERCGAVASRVVTRVVGGCLGVYRGFCGLDMGWHVCYC